MIPKLISLTEHNNPLILKEVYMVLSNIIAMKQDDMLESILKTPLINTITNSIYYKESYHLPPTPDAYRLNTEVPLY